MWATTGTASITAACALPASAADTVSLPVGYSVDVLIPWGTPIRSNGPAWKKDASNTAAEQAQQIGMHHDGMHFFPDHGHSSRGGLLVLNHEYIDNVLLYIACEENWNGYFGTEQAGWTPTTEQARYGIVAAGFGYRWHTADPRFTSP